jgi:hypothetical protein
MSNANRQEDSTQNLIAWPRITATLDDRTSGTLVINGIVHPCWAESIDVLRTGMIARCTATAISLGRPVRVDVNEGGQSWVLAVRPEGIVQEVGSDGAILPSDGFLSVVEGRCRRCRHINPVTASQCVRCGVEEPLGVLAAAPYSQRSPDKINSPSSGR